MSASCFLQKRRVLKCNQRLADMFGFASPADIEGNSTAIFYCSEEQFKAAGDVGYSQLARDGFANFELEMRRRDGSRIWVIQTGRPLDQAAVLDVASIWVYTDITERKQADIALRQSKQMFSAALESCPIAASIATTADGRFIEANANYERDFGWTRADLIGRTSRDIGLWPDLAERASWVAALRRDGRQIDYETIWVNRNGEYRNVSLASELIELDGQSCILAYVTDITARKRAEADLRIAPPPSNQGGCDYRCQRPHPPGESGLYREHGLPGGRSGWPDPAPAQVGVSRCRFLSCDVGRDCRDRHLAGRDLGSPQEWRDLSEVAHHLGRQG